MRPIGCYKPGLPWEFGVQLIRRNRDLRVDFFRGAALWWIFIDHIPENPVAQLSLRNFAVCDSAELFVLLAGYAAGLAYGRALDRSGYLFAAADVLKRAWTLYIAHIFLFVVFSAQVSYSAMALDRSAYLDESRLDVLAYAPYRALFEALTLRFQPAYLDILPMYIALLVLFAFALPLLRRPLLLAGLSCTLYVVARLGINLPSWTGGGWYFNPLAWQVLFILGSIFAYAPPKLPGRRVAWDILAAVVVVMGLLIQTVLWPHPEIVAQLPVFLARMLTGVDKQSLHPFRLMNMLALAWLVIRLVPKTARWLQSRWAGPFILCGQHSLPVFCVGIFLSFLGRLVIESDPNWSGQALANIAGPLILLGIGAMTAWFREKARQPAPKIARVSEADVT